MSFDPGEVVSFIEGRVGRKATTILAWLLFVVVVAWALGFLVTEIVVPLEKFFGGTGDLRADLISGGFGPFWPSLIATLFVLAGSVILFLPFMNLLIRGRHIPQTVINELEEKRSGAIHEVLNYPVRSDLDLTEWKRRDDRFVTDVTETLERHGTRADVLRFNRLGILTESRFGFTYNDEHGHRLMMLAKRLDTLERIIDRYAQP